MGQYSYQMGYNGLKKSWIFPGQASQFVGMGKDLFDNTDIGKKYYNLANDILEVDIQDISFNGPEERLKITKFTCLLYTSPSPRD